MTREDIMKRAEVLCAMDCVMAHLTLREVKQKCRSLAGGDGYFSIHAGSVSSGKCVYNKIK